MKNSLNWFDDPNPLRLGGKVFVCLLPALGIAGALCLVGVLIAAMATDPHGNGMIGGLQAIAATVLGTLLYAIVGALFTILTGFIATSFISLVDSSFGRILSPIAFGASSVGLSVIPIAIMGIFQQAFSTYPDSETFVFFYYVPIVVVGCSIGIWGASTKLPPFSTSHLSNLRFSTRQLLALTFWIALIFGIGFGNMVFLIASSIYIAIVIASVFAYSRFSPKTIIPPDIGE